MLAIQDFRDYNLNQIIKLYLIELLFCTLGLLLSLVVCLQYHEYVYFDSAHHLDRLASVYNTYNLLIILVLYCTTMSLSYYFLGLLKKYANFYLLEQYLKGFLAAALSFCILNNISHLSAVLDIGWQVWLLSLGLNYGCFVVIRTFFSTLTKSNVIKARTVVLGAGNKALNLKNNLAELNTKNNLHLSKNYSNEIIGYIHKPGDRERLTRENIINLSLNNNQKKNTILEYCIQNNINNIVVAVDDRRTNFPSVQLLECKQNGINVIELMEFYEQEFGKYELDVLDPSWIIYSNKLIKTKQQELNKNGLDRTLALSLLLLLSPLLIFIYVLLRINMGFSLDGFKKLKYKVINREPYVGRFGLVFNKYSFNCYKIAKKTNLNKITIIGWFIKKMRLDNLPILFNILCGQISFVGPKLLSPQEEKASSTNLWYFRQRFAVKPGLISWGYNNPNDRNNEDSTAKQELEYDLYYIKNSSCTFDLILLFNALMGKIVSSGITNNHKEYNNVKVSKKDSQQYSL